MAKKTKSNGKPAPKPRTPRSQTLPTMERLRDQMLDNLCESIGDYRDTRSQLDANEAADMQAALQRMHDLDAHSYQHAGIEMLRVPGGNEKLRVRRKKDEKPASAAAPSAQ